jgi:hypothetical protein
MAEVRRVDLNQPPRSPVRPEPDGDPSLDPPRRLRGLARRRPKEGAVLHRPSEQPRVIGRVSPGPNRKGCGHQRQEVHDANTQAVATKTCAQALQFLL